MQRLDAEREREVEDEVDYPVLVGPEPDQVVHRELQHARRPERDGEHGAKDDQHGARDHPARDDNVVDKLGEEEVGDELDRLERREHRGLDGAGARAARRRVRRGDAA
eukprot:6521911-Prymnesium_polylepis.2